MCRTPGSRTRRQEKMDRMKPVWCSNRQACVQPRHELFIPVSCPLSVGDKGCSSHPRLQVKTEEEKNVVFILERMLRAEGKLGITWIIRSRFIDSIRKEMKIRFKRLKNKMVPSENYKQAWIKRIKSKFRERYGIYIVVEN